MNTLIHHSESLTPPFLAVFRRMLHSRRRLLADKRGLTLVEVMVALFILASTMLTTALAMSYSLRTTSTARNRSLALHQARSEMELLRTYSYGADEVTTGRHNFTREDYSGYYDVYKVNSRVKRIRIHIQYYHRLRNVNDHIMLESYFTIYLH